jgi:enoyl-CoA hydratase
MNYDRFAPELLVSKDGPVRIITMNRPDDLNSFTDQLHNGMRRIWDVLVDDVEADAVVLTGAGKAFSSGGYLPNLERDHRDRNARRHDIREAERLARALIECELPIVAAVNGPAVGLGASLAMLCDIVIMSNEAFISDPHVSVGLVAGDGGPLTWPFMTSLLKAKEHILLGDRIYASEAHRLGLVNHVVPPTQVLPEALKMAHRLASQPKQAIRDTKRALNLQLAAAANLILPFALASESLSFENDEIRIAAEKFLAK